MERRFERDRRRHPRGGRRPGDQPGYCPLVMVIEPDIEKRDVTETILAKLRFAVAPVDSVDKAIALSHALRPSVIVCSEADVPICQGLLHGSVPIVTLTDHDETLIERIREAIRSGKVVPFQATTDS